jgi:hypothetical protein
MAGLDQIDGQPFNENEATRNLAYQQREWYRILVRVTDARIEAWVGGEKVIDSPRDGHRHALREAYQPLRPVGVSTWDTTGVLRNIHFRPLKRVASTRTSDKVVGVYEAPHLVTSAETADKFVGEVVAVVGEAVHGKTPNVRVTPDFYVVCVGHFQFKQMPGRQVFDWPKDIRGTQVKVIGRLKKSYLGETNRLPLIESNFGYFLQDGTYERIEPQQSAAPLPRDPRTGHSEGER